MPSVTTNRSSTRRGHPGLELRAAREGVGLTRAELAYRAQCAISSLGFMEAGAVPERSAVLDRAWGVIHRLEAERAERAAA